jgi:hypothetical protein
MPFFAVFNPLTLSADATRNAEVRFCRYRFKI